jgi:hypothetical protein
MVPRTIDFLTSQPADTPAFPHRTQLTDPLGRRTRPASIYGSLAVLQIRGPRSGAGTPGSARGKKSRSGSGMNISDHISESAETIFWVKNLKFLNRIRSLFDPDLRSGMDKFGSGIRNTTILNKKSKLM